MEEACLGLRGQAFHAISSPGAVQRWVAGGNRDQLALEPHIYLSPSLGPCSLPRETPKNQVGSLLTCLPLPRRRASASSLSSESSESSDAGEAQGCQGSLGGCLSLPTSLPIKLTSFPQPGGLRSLFLPTSGGAHHIQPRLAEGAVGRGSPQLRSHLLRTEVSEPQPHLGGIRAGSWSFDNTHLPLDIILSFKKPLSLLE